MQTLLSIIILSYNTKDLTVKCLESIVRQYKKELQSGEFELLVVDNASSDQTVATINNQQSTVNNKSAIKIIENKENLGFSKGNNVGAKNARGKYLFFLNSDTEVLDDGILEMIKFLSSNDKIGILGARLQSTDGSDQKSVGKFYNLRNVFLMLGGLERFRLLRSSPSEKKFVDWVSAAALMIRKDLFNKLSGFDEKLFMYMEDMELCYRVGKEGYKIGFYPNVKIVHKSLGSSNKTFAIINIYSGILYFYKKHKNYFSYIIVKTLLYIKAIVAIIIGFLIRNKYLTTTYKKALSYL